MRRLLYLIGMFAAILSLSPASPVLAGVPKAVFCEEFGATW